MSKKEVEHEDSIGNQDSMIEHKAAKRLLPCVLTERERLELGENISRTVIEIGKKEDERKAAAEQFKADLSELEKSKNIDARILNAGKIEREVDIDVTYNFRAGTVRVVRLDTQEIVEYRPMNSLERQQGMGF